MKLFAAILLIACLVADTMAITIGKAQSSQMEYVPGQDKYIAVKHHEMATFEKFYMNPKNAFGFLNFEDGDSTSVLILVLIIILIIIGVVLCCCCCACCAFAGAAKEA